MRSLLEGKAQGAKSKAPTVTPDKARRRREACGRAATSVRPASSLGGLDPNAFLSRDRVRTGGGRQR